MKGVHAMLGRAVSFASEMERSSFTGSWANWRRSAWLSTLHRLRNLRTAHSTGTTFPAATQLSHHRKFAQLIDRPSLSWCDVFIHLAYRGYSECNPQPPLR